MGEQPGSPDSQSSIEDRVANALFGEDDSPDDPQASDPPVEEADGEESEADEQPEAPDAAPDEGSSELEEINYLGKSYRVPKGLADDFRQRDAYTRRTQEVAERARVVEAYEQQMQVRAAFEQATADKREQLATLQSQWNQFKAIDWSQLDTDSIVRLKTQQDALRDKIGEINGALNADLERVLADVERSKRDLIKAGADYLAKTVPGWGPDRMQAIQRQALAEGFTAEQVATMSENPNPLTPMLFKLLDKAERLAAIEARSKAALEKAKSAPPVVKPGAADPQLSERMKTLNFRKQVKTARSSSEKNALILARLEKKFG